MITIFFFQEYCCKKPFLFSFFYTRFFFFFFNSSKKLVVINPGMDLVWVQTCNTFEIDLLRIEFWNFMTEGFYVCRILSDCHSAQLDWYGLEFSAIWDSLNCLPLAVAQAIERDLLEWHSLLKFHVCRILIYCHSAAAYRLTWTGISCNWRLSQLREVSYGTHLFEHLFG